MMNIKNSKKYLYDEIMVLLLFSLTLVYSYFYKQNSNLLAQFIDTTLSEAANAQVQLNQKVLQISQTALTWTWMSFALIAYLKKRLPSFVHYAKWMALLLVVLLLTQTYFYIQIEAASTVKLTLYGVNIASFVMALFWYGVLAYIQKRKGQG